MLKFIGIIFLIHISSCLPAKLNNLEAKTELVLETNVVTQSQKILRLKVSVLNNAIGNFVILKKPDFSTGIFSDFQLIIETSGKHKMSFDNSSCKRRIAQKYDYTKLNYNETINYSYEVDMSALVDSLKKDNLTNVNSDFGKYKIQVIYRDVNSIMQKALKHSVSNTVEIEYLP